MARLSPEKRECTEAYNKFERKRKIYGLDITHIPEPPPKHQIDNYGAPKNERVFKPIELPKVVSLDDPEGNPILTYFEGMTTPEEAQDVVDGVEGAMIGQKEKDFIKLLYKYRTEGYFWYNGDQLEYITGDHWYMLNVLKVDKAVVTSFGVERVETNPDFIDAQRDVFLHWQQCVKSSVCFGQMLITRRRFAKTTIGQTILLNSATSKRRSRNGIQAQNLKGAKDIFDKVVNMWRKLPKHPFFFPTHAGEDNPANILAFREPRKSSSKIKYMIQEDVLESWVDHRSTKPAAYEGSGLTRFYLDEASKIEDCDLIELFNVARETLAIGSMIAGKMMVTSTAENIGGKTLEQFLKLWKDSMLSTREDSPMNMTSSGLYPLFVPADYGYVHDFDEDGDLPDEFKKPTIDKFGYSDRDMARKIILAARKNKRGSSLIQYIRKYPLTVEEAFTFGVSDSPIPQDKIQEQKMFNFQVNEIVPEPILKRGRFVWIHQHGDLPKAKFIEDEKGLWLINPKLEAKELNLVQRHATGFSPNTRMRYMGVDPYDHKSTEDGEFSKAAAVVISADPKHFFKPCVMAVYHGRPSDPKIMYEDMLKAAVYFGCETFIENQKPGCVNHFIDEGYRGYLGKDPFNPHSKTDGISMRDMKKRTLMVDRLITYVTENVGMQELADGSKITSEHYFDRLLQDWYNFNPQGDKWTKFDLTVASLLALSGLEKPVYEVTGFKLEDLF